MLWKEANNAQEHGVLVRKESAKQIAGDGYGSSMLQLGSVVQIISQHACLTLANHQWFYIVDSSLEGGVEKVVDVWVPWKGW